MKTIKFKKKWRHRIDDTTVHEYPVGSEVVVSNEVADLAVKAEVLDGDPVEAVEPKADKADGKSPPKV